MGPREAVDFQFKPYGCRVAALGEPICTLILVA